MKQVILFLALLFGWVVGARADVMGPATASGAISLNGRYVVRLPVNIPNTPKPELVIYAYDEATSTFRIARSVEFNRHDTPQFLFISDDGKHVIFVSIEKPGIRALSIYGEQGLLKSWDLKSLLSDGERKKCMSTGSTIQWFDTGQFGGDRFELLGPSRTIQGFGEGRRAYIGDEPTLGYRLEIDMASLSLKKVSLPLPSPLSDR